MTIHHDKLAYGKLDPNQEDMSEKQIEEMLKELNAEKDENDDDAEKDKK